MASAATTVPLAKTIGSIAYDPKIKSLANSYGLDVNRVSWEDPSRFKGSVWGSNITDMTLVCDRDRMPVVRKPNFADVTADRPVDDFKVVVGNESGEPLEQIPLKEYIENIQKYTGNSNIDPLFLDRDNTILTSAQACILPLKDGSCEFSVDIFNYQSTESDDPAVLVIMSSAQGTSCTIARSTTHLYFNHKGDAYKMKAERLADDRTKRGVDLNAPLTADEKNRNMLYIYQIPLMQTKRVYKSLYKGGGSDEDSYGEELCEKGGCAMEGMFSGMSSCAPPRGFDKAVLSQGSYVEPFFGTNGLHLERDKNYPIRCTVQFYNVTDTPEVSEDQIKEIANCINCVYNGALASGSLVMSVTNRVTESVKAPAATTESKGPAATADFMKDPEPLSKFA